MPDLVAWLRRLALPWSRFLELLGREVPVEKAVDHGLHEFGAAILVVDVVRVLPDVEREERGRPHRERIGGVRSGDDLELVAAGDEPRPAAAEAIHGGLRELLLELRVAAARFVDPARDLPRRRAARGRPEAIPEERVVPSLRGVVEDLLRLLAADARRDHVLERHLGETRAGDELVQLLHVGGVVLSVVQADGARGNDGIEGIFRPRQRGKREGCWHRAVSWEREYRQGLSAFAPRGSDVGRFRRGYQPNGSGELSCADRSRTRAAASLQVPRDELRSASLDIHFTH